jgi:hypothetical protein
VPVFRAVREGVTSWDRVDEIGELILGKKPGRTSDAQITLYKTAKSIKTACTVRYPLALRDP